MNIGDKAKVVVKCPVGPTCTLIYHYPNGFVAELPDPTHPNPGWWQWTWAVPADAKTGEARGVANCFDDGKQRGFDTDFTIKAGSWSLKVQVQSPFDHTTLPETGLRIIIDVVGTMPENPSTELQSVVCFVEVTPESGGLETGSETFSWNNDQSPIVWYWQHSFDASTVGTAGWKVRCYNDDIEPNQFKSDSGTFVIS